MDPSQMAADPEGISDDDIDAAVSDDAMRAEKSAESQLADLIPVADEPLDPSRVNALGEALRKTLEAWGTEPPMLGEVKAPLEQMPLDIGKFLIALASTASDPSIADKAPTLAGLAFDPIEAMASNKGLIDATVLVRKMSDTAVVDELQGASDGVQDRDSGSPSPGDEPDPRAGGSPGGADTPEPAPPRTQGPAGRGRGAGRGAGRPA